MIRDGALEITHRLRIEKEVLADIGPSWESRLSKITRPSPLQVLMIELSLLLFSKQEFELDFPLVGELTYWDGLKLAKSNKSNDVVDWLLITWVDAAPGRLLSYSRSDHPGSARTPTVLRNIAVRFPLGDSHRLQNFRVWEPLGEWCHNRPDNGFYPPYRDYTMAMPGQIDLTRDGVANTIKAYLDSKDELSTEDLEMIVDLLDHYASKIVDVVAKYLPKVTYTPQTAARLRSIVSKGSGKTERKCLLWLSTHDTALVPEAGSPKQGTQKASSSRLSQAKFLALIDRKRVDLPSLELKYGAADIQRVKKHFVSRLESGDLPDSQAQALSRLIGLDHEVGVGFDTRAGAIEAAIETRGALRELYLSRGIDSGFLFLYHYIETHGGKGEYLTPVIWRVLGKLFDYEDSLSIPILRLALTKADDTAGYDLVLRIVGTMGKWEDFLTKFKDDEVKFSVMLTAKSESFRELYDAKIAAGEFKPPVVQSYWRWVAEKRPDEKSQKMVLAFVHDLLAKNRGADVINVMHGFRKVAWSPAIAEAVLAMGGATKELADYSEYLLSTRTPSTFEPLPRRFVDRFALMLNQERD